MNQSDKFKFYAFNLKGGDDTRIPAQIYAQTFGWSIITESAGHTELRISDQITVVFSRPTDDCPVEPGTLTVVTDRLDFKLGHSFRLESDQTSQKNYISYLDFWGNRIWFYRKNNSDPSSNSTFKQN